MTSMLKQKDWSTQARRALTAPELVAKLAQMDGWQLHGDGADVAITKTFRFDDYHETMAFVNAVAFIAHTQDHHPDLSVHYNRCVVRFNTHDVGGISPNTLPFVKGRKSLFIGLNFDNSSVWKAQFGYTAFFGGGLSNIVRDRDNLAASLSYSF